MILGEGIGNRQEVECTAVGLRTDIDGEGGVYTLVAVVQKDLPVDMEVVSLGGFLDSSSLDIEGRVGGLL